jgi:hypothetical protein
MEALVSQMVEASGEKDDLVTVAALAAASFVAAISLHEHLGHAATCALTKCDLTKLGAFYVDYAPKSLTGSASWIVPAAGPVVSLVVGLIAFVSHRRLTLGPRMRFFLWHFFTVNLMIAAGYCLFSGFSGRGDLGTGVDEALHNARPQALLQIGLIAIGAVGYFAVLKVSVAAFSAHAGGGGEERVKRAQRTSLTAFLAGVAVALIIGILNPEGASILLISAAMSSIGGTSGLGWMMMQFLDRKHVEDAPPRPITRDPKTIAACAVVVVAYAAIFGPTLNV